MLQKNTSNRRELWRWYSIVLVWKLFLIESTAIETERWMAKVDLHADGSRSYIGTLIFVQANMIGSPVQITGSLRSLIPNTRYHGFHVHQYSIMDGRWNCSLTRDHWNPFQVMHGSRFDPVDRRHVGDLGNIWSDQSGSVLINMEDPIIQLHPGSISSILGKSIVIHKYEDDLGRSGREESRRTGNSGPRIACGNIHLLHTDTNYYLRQQLQKTIPFSRCDCLTNIGQCVPFNTYRCQFDRRVTLMQSIGNNRWVSIGNCLFSCQISSRNEPICH